MRCPACGAEVGPGRLSCPFCQALLYAGELKRLSEEAAVAARDGLPGVELAAWRQALELLPRGSRQAVVIAGRVETLGREPDRPPGEAAATTKGGSLRETLRQKGWLAALGLALLKLKSVLFLLLAKGKLLLLGLTKLGTLSTLLLSLGLYWAAFGWKFAAGLIGSIYVHEMGHVAALKRLGIRASAPMFIPGFGALVRLRQSPASPREDAQIGLAGPLWGLGAALVAFAVYRATGWASWAAIARTGAWLNLFNLLPFWQLDGARGFRPLTRNQRLLAAGGLALAWLLTREGLLLLLLVLALVQAFQVRAQIQPPPPDGPVGDRRALLTYLLLVVALSALCLVVVPGRP
jgi:Zn-dependent protease